MPRSILLEREPSDLSVLLESLGNSSAIVLKPISESQGRGVKILDANNPNLEQEIKASLEQYQSILIEERIVSFPRTLPTGEKLDWNLRVLCTPFGIVDIEVRTGLDGEPINKSKGAIIEEFSAQTFSKESAHLYQAVVEKIEADCKRICEKLKAGFLGLDYIITPQGEPVLIETNAGSVGGLSSLAEIRTGKQVLLAAKKMAAHLIKVVNEKSKTIVPVNVGFSIKPEYGLSTQDPVELGCRLIDIADSLPNGKNKEKIISHYVDVFLEQRLPQDSIQKLAIKLLSSSSLYNIENIETSKMYIDVLLMDSVDYHNKPLVNILLNNINVTEMPSNLRKYILVQLANLPDECFKDIDNKKERIRNLFLLYCTGQYRVDLIVKLIKKMKLGKESKPVIIKDLKQKASFLKRLKMHLKIQGSFVGIITDEFILNKVQYMTGPYFYRKRALEKIIRAKGYNENQIAELKSKLGSPWSKKEIYQGYIKPFVVLAVGTAYIGWLGTSAIIRSLILWKKLSS